MDCTDINPYSGDSRAKGEQVRDMFDNIAPAYDLLNRAMTLGIDTRWRRRAVKMLQAVPHDRILDLATGTGDLAFELARRLDPVEVTGLDLSEQMIAVARQKASRLDYADCVKFATGDCLQLPFTSHSFDCVTCAYGVRNFENLLTGYREMHRVLKPSGTLCIIELSTPTLPIVRGLYKFYSTRVIPALGRMLSRDGRAYTYLPQSIAAVPQGEQMLSLITQAGFENARFLPLTLGVCTIYTATKPL